MKKRKTSLIVAAEMGEEGIVKLLVKKEANLNKKDWIGMSALMHAVKENNKDVARYRMSL